ncbi:MAG: hypothetical protein LBK66_00875, partial [Spirochaetaceae bacterium]|nr:hypothetical protein [Spirochaetaceae bacterium]
MIILVLSSKGESKSTPHGLTIHFPKSFVVSVNLLTISSSSGKSGNWFPSSGAVTGGYSAQDSR